jgi:hypothetical protein
VVNLTIPEATPTTYIDDTAALVADRQRGASNAVCGSDHERGLGIAKRDCLFARLRATTRRLQLT